MGEVANSLMELVITTVGVLLTMALLCILCCLCMKISDLKLKCYIIETAKKKGIDIDIDKLECKGAHQLKDETCAIMVPMLSQQRVYINTAAPRTGPA